MNHLIYKFEGTMSSDSINQPYRIDYWRPSIFNWFPPGRPIKYFVWSLFSLLKVFKNNKYSVLLLYVNDQLAHSCMVVPAHFRWPFMGENDVQFTYVKTSHQFKGQGIAYIAVKTAMETLKKPDVNFWYVTDKDNEPSIKLAEKLGFKLFAHGKRESMKYITRVKKLVICNN